MLTACKSYLKKIIPNQILSTYQSYKFKSSYPPITPLPRVIPPWRKDQLLWFQKAKNHLVVNRISGVYAEFGVHTAMSFRLALNTLGIPNPHSKITHFYAFDSFEGMPQPAGIDQQKIWRKGMNKTGVEEFKEICKKDLHRTVIIPGFFDQILPKYNWNTDHKIALVNIDVDYYSSTVSVLNFVQDKLQHGSIIAFDDWNCFYGDPLRGQKRAFSEWKEKLKDTAIFEPYQTISFGGMSFIYLEKSKLGQEIL